MAKNKKPEPDSVYLLKLILYLILGALWLKIVTAGNTVIPIPAGALIGLLFAAHDHFQLDRKVEYAVLVVAMFVGYLAGVGLSITWH